MPLPMTVPTTTAAAWLVVRRRASSGRDTTGRKTGADEAIGGVGIKDVRTVSESVQKRILGVKG